MAALPQTDKTKLNPREKLIEARGFAMGFKTFIKDFGVAPLAIGVVIGTAVNEFIKTTVDGLITPLISLISPNGRLQTLQWVVRGSTFKIGAVVNSLISFLIICIVVYFFIKLILHDDKLLKKN